MDFEDLFGKFHDNAINSNFTWFVSKFVHSTMVGFVQFSVDLMCISADGDKLCQISADIANVLLASRVLSAASSRPVVVRVDLVVTLMLDLRCAWLQTSPKVDRVTINWSRRAFPVLLFWLKSDLSDCWVTLACYDVLTCQRRLATALAHHVALVHSLRLMETDLICNLFYWLKVWALMETMFLSIQYTIYCILNCVK